MTIYEYVAPPEPAAPEGTVIEVPEKEGTPVTVISYENGMTMYVHRVRWDWTASERLMAFVQQWLNTDEFFLGIPPASMPEHAVWIPRATWLKLLNVHDNVVQSPLAVPQSGGKRIIVPGPNDVVLSHGPGKRKHR